MKKTIFLIVGCLLLIGSLTLNFYQHRNGNKETRRTDVLLQAAASKGAPRVNDYKAPAGEKVATFKEVEVKSEIEKISVAPVYQDTVKKALANSNKKVDQLTAVNSTLLAEVKLLRSQLGNALVYKDRWLSVMFNPSDSVAKIAYNAEIITARYQKGKSRFIDVFSPDERVTVNGLQRFTEDLGVEKPRRLGIGLQVGYSYIPSTNSFAPTIGAGLSYNFLSK